MMTFRSFCLVMVVVLLRHTATTPQTCAMAGSGPAQTIDALVGVCVLFCVLGKGLALTAALRSPRISQPRAWHAFETQRRWLEWSWVGIQSWLLPGSPLGRCLIEAQASGYPDSLLIVGWFMPSLIVLSALELSTAQLETDWEQARPGRSTTRHAVATRWWLRIRFGAVGHILTCLVPVVVALAAIDALKTLAPGLGPLLQMAFALSVLAIACLALAPLWLATWYRAELVAPDEGPRRRVIELCHHLNVVAPGVYRVGTGSAFHGAALVGWLPFARQLWFGPSVTEQLTVEQFDMVLLHELAHLRRGHCWWRLIPIAATGTIAAVVFAGPAAMATAGLPEDWVSWMAMVLVIVVMVLGLGRISCWCELDADRDACRQATRWCAWAADRPGRSAEALRDALIALHGPAVNRHQRFWLHPSLTMRLSNLAKLDSQ